MEPSLLPRAPPPVVLCLILNVRYKSSLLKMRETYCPFPTVIPRHEVSLLPSAALILAKWNIVKALIKFAVVEKHLNHFPWVTVEPLVLIVHSTWNVAVVANPE